MIDLVLSVLKFAGIALAGVFGIYGLLVKFKDEHDRITKGGRVALILIIVSTLVGVLSAAVEIYRENVREQNEILSQATQALQASRRTELLISEINRTLQPISELSVSYSWSISADHPMISAYGIRVKSEIPALKLALTSDGRFPGYVGSVSDGNGVVESIEFESSASLSPDRNRDSTAYGVLSETGLTLNFYRTPIDPAEHSAIVDRLRHEPDLEVALHSRLAPPRGPENHSLKYTLKNHRLHVIGTRLTTDSRFWKSTGRIVSVVDLVGSQLFVIPPSISGTGGLSALDQQRSDILKTLSLGDVRLSFGKGRDFWIPPGGLRVVRRPNGSPVYVYSFPATVEELNRLSR